MEIKTNLELLYTQLNKVYVELGSRLRDDKPVVNWFNNELNNLSEFIRLKIEGFDFDELTAEQRIELKAIQSNIGVLNRSFIKLFEQYEIEFKRFNSPLEDYLSDIESGKSINVFK